MHIADAEAYPGFKKHDALNKYIFHEIPQIFLGQCLAYYQ